MRVLNHTEGFTSMAKLFWVGVGGITFGFLAYTGAGIASADTHILVGGNTDCTSQQLLQIKNEQRDVHGTPVPIEYGDCVGDFAPFLGSVNMTDAVQQGVDATQAAWDQNCSTGQRCTLEGFSIGAPVVSIVGDNVGADRPGSNTHVVTDGNPYGTPGFMGPNSQLGDVVKPMAAGFGVVSDAPIVAGSENRFNVNDFWANGGGQTVGAVINQGTAINGIPDLLPPQHEVPNPDALHDTYVDENGVTNEVYGEPLAEVVNPADQPADEAPAP